MINKEGHSGERIEARSRLIAVHLCRLAAVFLYVDLNELGAATLGQSRVQIDSMTAGQPACGSTA